MRRFLDRSLIASGTVVELKTTPRNDYRPWDPPELRWFYFPVFSFTDAAGQQHTVEETTGFSSAATFALGKSVTVRYDPDVPGKARLVNETSIWLRTKMLLFVGVGLLPFALFLAPSAIHFYRSLLR